MYVRRSLLNVTNDTRLEMKLITVLDSTLRLTKRLLPNIIPQFDTIVNTFIHSFDKVTVVEDTTLRTLK
jgi:hypothetical protein